MKGMLLTVVILMLGPWKLEGLTRSLSLPNMISLDLNQAKSLLWQPHGYRANEYRRQRRGTKSDSCQPTHLAQKAGRAGTSFSPPQVTHTLSKSASPVKGDLPISGRASLGSDIPSPCLNLQVDASDLRSSGQLDVP